jgi:hypothetical protein
MLRDWLPTAVLPTVSVVNAALGCGIMVAKTAPDRNRDNSSTEATYFPWLMFYSPKKKAAVY